MNWKKWKIGMVVAVVTGLFTALVALGAVGADKVTWQAFLIILAVNIGTQGLLFLKEHPYEQVDFTPAIAVGFVVFLVMLTGCASEKWVKRSYDGNGKLIGLETYRGHDLFKDTKSRGWKAGHETKTTKTAFSRGAYEANTDEAAMSAAGEQLNGLAHSLASGLAEGFVKGTVKP